MKMPTSDAARELGVHPANLLLMLSGMVGSLEDCWPEVDRGLVDTALALDPSRRRQRGQEAEGEKIPDRESESQAVKLRVSPDAARIIEKLWRHDKWGKATVTLRTLQNEYCKGVEDIDEAVKELRKIELLITGSSKDTYSLNPAKKGEIENIAKTMTER